MMNYLLLGIAVVLLVVALYSLLSYLKDKRKDPFSRRKHH